MFVFCLTVFSSHMMFTVLCALVITHYGRNRKLRRMAWFAVITLAVCVIGSRKHYTVSI